MHDNDFPIFSLIGLTVPYFYLCLMSDIWKLISFIMVIVLVTLFMLFGDKKWGMKLMAIVYLLVGFIGVLSISGVIAAIATTVFPAIVLIRGDF